MKRRMAMLVAGAFFASGAAMAANYGPAYQGNQVPPSYPAYTYPSPNAPHAPMASEDWDNPAYNASDAPDNFPWFGNSLLGQRPNPAQWHYFQQREAQFAQQAGAGTAVCHDSMNRPFYC